MRNLVSRVFPWLGVAVFTAVLGGYLYAKTPAAGTGVPLAAPAVTVDDTLDDWYTVLYQGKRLGYTHTRRTLEEGGLRADDEMRLRMKLMGQPRDVSTATELHLDAAGAVKSFTFRMDSGGVGIRIDGVQEPGKVRLKMFSAGTTQNVEYPVAEPVVMAGNLMRDIARAGLKAGAVYTRSFFDPSVMKPAKMTLTVGRPEPLKLGARTLTVFPVTQIYNGLETVSYVDGQGVTYKELSPTGFSSYRTSREDALRETGDVSLDLIDATSVVAENAPRNPRQLTRLVLELQDVDLAGFDLDGDGQSLAGRTLTIDRTQVRPATDTAERYLASEPLMQVDDPAVKQAALEATGGLRDRAEASKRVLKWVYENLAKASTVSLPSAVEVLRTRQGDCNEHAILYTAMSRAAGVPARVASGIVALGDRFYYHAWAEVLLDGHWVAVDPVFGQYPADATHVRFVVGGLERQAELMRVIGKLKLKVVWPE